MTFHLHASTLARQSLGLLMLGSALLVHAAPVQYVTPKVTIDFDPDGFALSRAKTTFGGTVTEDIAPSQLSFGQVNDNGIRMDFNGFMAIHASSYTDYAPESASGSFSALFHFTPQAGYVITGYTITLAAAYRFELPASWSGWASGGAVFGQVGVIDGPALPAITGGIDVSADVALREVFDGEYTFIHHYETVLDYCETEEPFNCYTREEPVYGTEYLYHEEPDFGEASIDLWNVMVLANVVAVPEPDVIWLMAGALPLVAWCRRRRASRVTRYDADAPAPRARHAGAAPARG
jgi:hypothetical protein